ncbi:cell wall / vacuolar inhibitor of fructosidase 1 [Rosa sericea]
MKSSVRLAGFVCLIHVVFLSISHCRVFLPNDLRLIEQTCNKTPHRDLCVSALTSDPESTGADVKGLARIMADVILRKATNDTQHKIEGMIAHSPGDQRLTKCRDDYKVIKTKIDSTNAYITKRDYKSAEESMNDAIAEANICEGRFPGRSPLIYENKLEADIADLAAEIVIM